MKIASCGDQHITNRRPKNRTDDYFGTVLDKFEQECQIAVEENCEIVILPGDVFDSYKENHLVVQCIISLMKKYPPLHFLCVAGQHDQQFHNPDLSGTTLGTLLTHTDLIILLTSKPYIINNTCFYGLSWNEEIPEIITPDCVNILVCHKMIVDEKLWAQQEGHTWANHILLKYKFDLIVSGDNHKQFTVRKGSQHLVNMGSMMRSTIAQIDHHPAVMIYDTCKQEIFIIDLEIKPFHEVMQIDKATKEKERNEKLESFVHSLKDKPIGQRTLCRDFVSSLEEYTTVNDVEQEVQDIIWDCVKD